MSSRAQRVSTVYLRNEPTHLDGTGEVEVEYEIVAYRTVFRPATWHDPPEGGEIEDHEVWRLDPRVDSKLVRLASSEDPFDTAEWERIDRQLAEVEIDDDPGYDED